MEQLYLVSGYGLASLQECYQLLGENLESLEEFMAGGRQDGLVTYSGPDGLWQAIFFELGPDAIQLLRAKGIEVSPA